VEEFGVRRIRFVEQSAPDFVKEAEASLREKFLEFTLDWYRF